MNNILFQFCLINILFLLLLYSASTHCALVFEDLEFDFDVVDVVKQNGYPIEVHTVVTDDGYKLTLHRIPRPDGVPILFHHGLLSDATCFFFAGNESLPFLLVNEGYDVWLCNYRGTVYSKGHVKYTWNDPTYWDWSWSEMGIYDIPAFVKYIYKLTNKKSINIGYSMGTTTLAVALSTYPEMRDYMRGAFWMAPSIYMTRHIYAFKSYMRNAKILKRLFSGSNSLLLQVNLRNLCEMSRKKCSLNKENALKCISVAAKVLGDHTDYSKFNVSDDILRNFANYPRITSYRTLIHYGQIMASGEFQYYNWGIRKNFMKYGSLVPPFYNLRRNTVPIAIIYSEHDFFCVSEDIDRLWREINDDCKHLLYKIPQEDFNHLGFSAGKNAKVLVYDKFLEIIRDFLKT